MRLPLDAKDARALLRRACPGRVLPVETVALTRDATLTRRAGGDGRGHADGARPVPRAVVAIGAFDGVHIGHQRLIRLAVADADRRGVPCVAVTFDPDPADVLVGPVAGSRLLAPADRPAALLAAGADLVVTIEFTPRLAKTTYQEFLEEWLAPIVGVVSLHVGADFRLGRAGEGTIEALAAYAERRGASVHGHELLCRDGAPVTSTRVRALIAAGDIEEASELLDHVPVVRGEVTHGRGEGSPLGFPTANVRADALACAPAAGVYGGYVIVDQEPLDEGTHPSAVAYAAAINVGAPPTFSSRADPTLLEANLVDFHGDLYGRKASVAFCRRLRSSRRFESTNELVRTVEADIGWVGENLDFGEVVL